MSIRDSLKNAAVLSGSTALNHTANAPQQYGSQRKMYFHNETSTFTQQYGKYAADCIEAEAQGIYADKPKEWTKLLVRLADVVHPSAITTKNPDDYKEIFILSREIEYIRPGTKFRTMGSYWIATYTGNLSNGDGRAMIQRCNTVWNFLDYYGNVQSEPMITERLLASANENAERQSVLIAKGYFTIKCQWNENTAQLDTNSRMILGRGCYHITGYSDFETEFTGDYNSRSIMAFTARYEEPNREIDDMEKHIAGGKLFSWHIGIKGKPTMTVGETVEYTATSERYNREVESTEENPIDYEWKSSDESVAKVDESGAVTAISVGTCKITAILKQNAEISSDYDLAVENADTEPHIKFMGTTQESLKPYESETITASYFENGVQTEEPIEWELSEATETAYGVSKETDNSITIKCWGYSEKPLTITAKCKGLSATETITLEGI